MRITAVGVGALLTVAALGIGQAAALTTRSGAAVAAPDGAAAVTAQRLEHAASEPSQWMTYGGTYEEQRYSRLAQINRENVGRLGLVWYADYDTHLSQD